MSIANAHCEGHQSPQTGGNCGSPELSQVQEPHSDSDWILHLLPAQGVRKSLGSLVQIDPCEHSPQTFHPIPCGGCCLAPEVFHQAPQKETEGSPNPHPMEDVGASGESLCVLWDPRLGDLQRGSRQNGCPHTFGKRHFPDWHILSFVCLCPPQEDPAKATRRLAEEAWV